MSKFEVTIYNEEVRQKVKDGEHHSRFTDDWADFHYIEIDAPNESQARERAEERYPSKQGFVIDSVLKSLEHDFE
mgnify:CR=1 FL=1